MSRYFSGEDTKARTVLIFLPKNFDIEFARSKARLECLPLSYETTIFFKSFSNEGPILDPTISHVVNDNNFLFCLKVSKSIKSKFTP